MATALELALETVPLATGRTYRCQVRGQLVEVRVLPPPESDTALVTDDVRLDAWVELPPPKPLTILRAKPGKWPQPDVPAIPTDEEASP